VGAVCVLVCVSVCVCVCARAMTRGLFRHARDIYIIPLFRFVSYSLSVRFGGFCMGIV
jgi:hypothetical protein